jgi:DNA-binding response OmpR family regulator/HPt (histidine-containing phosphotransfer) domain-containing protein
MVKILSIENDHIIAAALMGLMTQHHYIVESVQDVNWAWQLLKQSQYDLIVMDVTLPELNGISLCRRIRSHSIKTPIVIIADQGPMSEKTVGLDAGADDYLVKPFHPEELCARIRALLRRSVPATDMFCFDWGNLHLNPVSAEVRHCSDVLPLTPKEFALLELFLRHPQQVFSCSAILDKLWPYPDAPSEEAVRTHIKGLRQKLKAGGIQHDPIETVYGMGYRLGEAPIDPSCPVVNPPENPPEITPETASIPKSKSSSEETDTVAIRKTDPEPTQALIRQIWMQSYDRIQFQIETVQAGINSLLNPEFQATAESQCLVAAQREAHTLSGSLEIFGFMKASKIAEHIELGFLNPAVLNADDGEQFQALLIDLQKEISPSKFIFEEDRK